MVAIHWVNTPEFNRCQIYTTLKDVGRRGNFRVKLSHLEKKGKKKIFSSISEEKQSIYQGNHVIVLQNF